MRTHVYAVRQQLYSCCSRNPIVEQGRAQRGPWLMLSIFLRVRIGMVLVRTEYGVVRTYPHVLLRNREQTSLKVQYGNFSIIVQNMDFFIQYCQ